jgi:hypothetical protein
MRGWIRVATAVAVVAGAAGCSEADQGPKDEVTACLTAINDSRGFGASLGTSIQRARGNATLATVATDHYQDMANAKQYATDWLAKIRDLESKDISPQLRQTLGESEATVKEILVTLDDVRANPPDASGKLAVVDDNINKACDPALNKKK